VAPPAILTAFMYVNEWDATGNSRSMSFKADQKQLDATTFRSGGWEEVASGQKKLDFAFNGFWSSATTTDQDTESFSNLGVKDRVFTAGVVETEGQPCFFWKGGQFSYQAFGQINELAPFSIASTGTEGIAGATRGRLMKAKGNVSGTGGMGSVVQVGAVGASQFLYAVVHVFSAGTSISINVASDDNVGFASGTTRGSIGPLTTTGGTYMTRVAGPITDDYWLLNVTAITGTFNIAGAIAVQ